MNRSLILSISLAALALVWILSGSLSNTDDSEHINQQESASDESKVSAPLFKVKVQAIDAELMVDRIDLQGGIESEREIEIRTETDGVITSLKAQKGARIA